MYMTDEEIYNNYISSKNPKRQVKILAELNGTSRDNIEDIIEKERQRREKEPMIQPDTAVKNKNWLSHRDKELMYEDLMSGMMQKDIAAKYGRSESAVSNAIATIRKEREQMTFAEELPTSEREQLTADIMAVTQEQPEPLSDDIGELPEGVTAVDIAKALMLMLGEEFDGYRIGIKFSDGWYQVEVHGTEDAAILRRKVDGDEQGD